ncbi:MAG TPA: aminoacyl-tRNA hydrolase [Anaerovoracaceae bacterium]|nr:aminoacyl-tRNA hydrolase [Anaerovoracaceae bacterium]
MISTMIIIIGLGNPGRRYEHTRHNVGFMAVDLLAEKHGIKINKIKHKALVGEGVISGHKVLLVKPQTYMNLSGQSVREVVSYYKVDLSDVIVVYDDIDISVGRLRIRRFGSSGTHNGMKSIIYDLQRDDFPRLRIGIGGERRMRLSDYVTGAFAKEEKRLMKDSITRAVSALECILGDGIDKAMNEYNSSNGKQADNGEKRKKDSEKDD